jgi:Ras-related protein Rab-5C
MFEEAQAYANEAGLLFMEASAKSGEYVMEVFTEIGNKSCTQSSFYRCPDMLYIKREKYL